MRRVTDQEGRKLQQIVRRGSTSSVRYQRAMMLLASAGGNRVPVVAQLVQADEEPRIGQLKPEGVLDVDPGPDSLRSLPVCQPLDELQHEHQRKPAL